MTNDEIAELRRLLAWATPGPWHCDGTTVRCANPHSEVMPYTDIARLQLTVGNYEGEESNANLIVAAVNALPALLDDVERLKGIAALAADYLAQVDYCLVADDLTREDEGMREAAEARLRKALLAAKDGES